MDYDKQPINVDEQVALLQNRGLVIEDIATAKLQLRNISYFRIASYLRYMEEDRQFHHYKLGSTFVTKEFAKAQRQIYKLISQTPQISAAQMSENMGISLRQVQQYLKQLSDQNLIVREGGRKNGVWKILDDEYEGFFKRI